MVATADGAAEVESSSPAGGLTPNRVRMPREWRDAWTAALRSGLYKQGQQFLRDRENRFSVLGVLCDLGPGDNWELAAGASYIFVLGNEHVSNELPKKIRMLTGLGCRPAPNAATFAERLQSWNDQGFSFDALAVYIGTVIPVMEDLPA